MSGHPARSRKRTKAGVYTSDIGFEALAATFHMPSNQACEVLGVGLTIFKRLCRKFGLHRWPYRALKKQGKLMQQGKQVSTADLQRILADCKVPFEWQSAAAAAAATERAAPAHGRTARSRSASASASASGSDLMGSDDDEEDDTGWEPGNSAPRRRAATRQAAQQAQQAPPGWQPSPFMWATGLGPAPAPLAAPFPAVGQPPSDLLAGLGSAPLAAAAPPPLRPTPRPADPSLIEQLQRGLLMPAQPSQQPALQLPGALQGDPLASLLAGFASVPAGDRQQVALLLKQLADVLDQQSRAAAVQALVARLQQPPPGASALAALLQQVQGGGDGASATAAPAPGQAQPLQPTPFSLVHTSSAPFRGASSSPPHSNMMSAVLGAASGLLPQPSSALPQPGNSARPASQASPPPPACPLPAQALLNLLSAASASGSLPPSLAASLKGSLPEFPALPDRLAAQLQAVQQEVAQQEAGQAEDKPQATALAAKQAAPAEPSAAGTAVAL